MRCSVARYQFESYLAGDLPGLRAHKLEQHLADCPTCRCELEHTRKLVVEIRGAFQTGFLNQQQLSFNSSRLKSVRAGWFPRFVTVVVMVSILLAILVIPHFSSRGNINPAPNPGISGTPIANKPTQEANEVTSHITRDWRIGIY